MTGRCRACESSVARESRTAHLTPAEKFRQRERLQTWRRRPVLPPAAACHECEQPQRFERRELVEIGRADFVQERVLVAAEERQLPVARG